MKNIDIKKYVLPNLPYLFIFWFFTKMSESYRLTVGDSITKAMGALSGLGAVMKNPLPSFHPQDLLVGLVGGAAIWLIVYFRKKNAKKYRHGVEYGSARWGNAEDIKPFIDPKPENNILLTQTERIMIGRNKQPKYNINKNVLVVGGSGSGKTRFHIKPNLMQMNSSYIVTDPKGTVLAEVGTMLHRGGYEIKVLNTINFKQSMKYNPFRYLHSENDILKLVNCIMENTKGEDSKGGEDFWGKAEALYYQALIAYIWYEAPDEEKNMTTLLEMLNASEVREDDEKFKNAVDLMFDRLEKCDPEHFAVRQYKKYKLAAGKTAVESVLSACDWRVDIILSHTCPLRYEPIEAFLPTIDQSTVDKSTEQWLCEIEHRLDYERWYCGHYHIEKEIDKLRFLFNDYALLPRTLTDAEADVCI